MNHIICPEAAHAGSTLAHKLCSQTYFQHSWYFSGSYKNELNGKVRVLSSLAFEKLQTHFPKWIQHHEFFSSIYIYMKSLALALPELAGHRLGFMDLLRNSSFGLRLK